MNVKNNLIIAMLVLFVEGFVSLSFQMLYIRQLIPFVGNSVEVVSWIIGVFLIALAIGYKKGGEYTGDIRQKLIKNLYFSVLIAGIGLSFLFVELYFASGVFKSYNLMQIYCLLIVFPVTYFLGQTLPLITNIMKGDKVSQISGNVLFLSTIGSFIGAIITTNILLKNFGVSLTIYINIILLMFLIFVLNISNIKNNLLFKSFEFIIILSFMYIINIPIEKENFVKTNQYANYKIIDNGTKRIFTSNKSYSSILEEEKKYGYIKYLEEILFNNLKIEDKEILIIGAGGFVLSKDLENTKNRFTYVDIDPEIKNIAEKHFLKESINGEFIALDGRDYINSVNKNFDVIVLDAYSANVAIPEHLASKEFLLSLKQKLNFGGILAINTIYKTNFSDEFSLKMNNTINSVFKNCFIVPINSKNEITNVEYICFNYDNNDIYTDDKNNANNDFYNLMKN
jgi:predicted membrane-bound spermidine synthase